jgi:hypothetical protein
MKTLARLDWRTVAQNQARENSGKSGMSTNASAGTIRIMRRSDSMYVYVTRGFHTKSARPDEYCMIRIDSILYLSRRLPPPHRCRVALSKVCQNALTTGRSVCRCFGSIYKTRSRGSQRSKSSRCSRKYKIEQARCKTYLERLDVPFLCCRMSRFRTQMKVDTQD